MLVFLLLCLAFTGSVSAAASAYTPRKTTCPSTPLVRDATGISPNEASYINARNPKAAAALHQWLQTAAPAIEASQSNYPVLALATSGGGLRSLLTGAGVHQAFDSRDSNVSTSGLYQALTYESGLSGGAWLLSSLASNNWPTISSLQSNLWDQAFVDTISGPPHFQTVKTNLAIALLGKSGAGFSVGVTDIYGQLLGYQLLYGKQGGIQHHLSDIASLTNFTAHKVPYPIITALNVHPGLLLPHYSGKQMEFHPYEFGSWDKGIAAFTPAQYMGSALSSGKPVNSSQCFTRFDSQAFVMGTSSSIFSALVYEGLKQAPQVQELVNALKLVGLPTKSNSIYFARYPNPFYQYSHSYDIQEQEQLNLVDGGDEKPDQGDPIWPMLHRDVDVLFVSANSADTSKNFPSGVEIHNTYTRAKAEGLKRMPQIPEADVFNKQALDKKSTVFGCYDDKVMTIVYLPNRDISYNSGTSTLKLKYTTAQTAAMIKNGMQIATEDDEKDWGLCVGCFVMKKVKGVSLPSECASCYKNYCYGKYVPDSSISGNNTGNGGGNGGNGGENNGGQDNGNGASRCVGGDNKTLIGGVAIAWLLALAL